LFFFVGLSFWFTHFCCLHTHGTQNENLYLIKGKIFKHQCGGALAPWQQSNKKKTWIHSRYWLKKTPILYVLKMK